MSNESRRRLLNWKTFGILLLWMASLVGAALAGAYAYRGRSQIRAMLRSVQGGAIIQTNLYNIEVRKLSIPAEGRDGGIAVLGEGILFANRFGRTWYVDPSLTLRELTLRIPINVEEFEADPYNDVTNSRELFAVKDLFVQPRRDGVRVLASYNHWYADDNCYVLRVSALETTEDALLEGGAPDGWTTVYETAPCRPLTENANGINRNPTLGAGGRVAALSDHEILVTVGGFGPETVSPDTPSGARIQDVDNPYGKTILLDLDSGAHRIYSVGHRNPQGLAISSGGEIWETEHAARGGDELNRILDGRNYGYPVVSYGTEYESMVWSTNPRQGHHDGFEKPMYAWVPSVGTSQVTVIEGPLFRHWQGDVVVSSLNQRTLFRVRVEDGRAVFVEPIFVEHRVRDVVEAVDGSLVLKTDDDFLVFLRPIDAESIDLSSLDAPTRGSLLASTCSGCHTFTADGPDGVGPSLWGVVGRNVAEREGYAYSEALRSLGGEWTEDRIESFLTAPNAVASGTTMAMTRTYSDSEISDLIAYLATLR